ncbi:MAG: T9SS type A sorting domain-containing protein [Ignavibacteria bacterium]|nr:T9SS type A sorting domain-containing protein [Ignavibacteria bacterium]
MNSGITGITRSIATWGDYDNDMDLDILITGIDNNQSYNGKVYQNNNGIFTDINAGLDAGQGSSAEWGDYDSDGDLDIVLTGLSLVDVHSRIYRNDNGIFVNINANIVDVTESSSSWGDFDNDGDLDLLLCGLNNSLRYSNIYRNDNGIFTDISADLTGVENRNGADWGDYDNDGDLDILLMGFDGTNYVTKIYRNDNTITNTTPSIPLNLTSGQPGNNSINLKWNKSTDAQTMQKGLTYNLSISTTPGGVEIFSPMSDLNTGYRKISALGNTDEDTSWTISNLPEGKYYWSVQAIDNSFAGSNFSPEQTFNITITSEGNLSSSEFPNEFELKQNYPNPFNPVTNLEFGISDLGFVSLKVYDLLGKEVATLVNEKLSPGNYKVEFDGSGLTSGVYFYRLNAGDFTDTKRMMLIK